MSVFENLQMGATLGNPTNFRAIWSGFSRCSRGLAERRDQRGGTSRGRAADAGDRPGADEPASPAAARRAVARAGAMIVRQIFDAIGRIAREEG